MKKGGRQVRDEKMWGKFTDFQDEELRNLGM